MNNEVTSLQWRYIVEKLLNNAVDMKNDASADDGTHKRFYDGMRSAYRDMIETMKEQSVIDDEEINNYGLNEL